MATSRKTIAGDKIKNSSKQDGLTLQQMSQINGVLSGRDGDMLNDTEILKINNILSEPGSKSAKLGATWTPVQQSGDTFFDIPDVDRKSLAKISSPTRTMLENTHVLGLVTFKDLSAFGRADYDEYATLAPNFIKSKDIYNKRAVAFTQSIESKEGVYTQRLRPVLVNKTLKVNDDHKIYVDDNERWRYEPWTQGNFVNPKRAIDDQTNRHLFKAMIPNRLTSDTPLSAWFENQAIGRKQLNRLKTQTNLMNEELTLSNDSVTPFSTINLSKEVADSANAIIEHIQNNGLTYTLDMKNDTRLVAKVNTGSGKYNVNLMDFNQPTDKSSIGSIEGNGINITVDRSVRSNTPKAIFRKENGVTSTSDPLGPLKIVLGESVIKNSKFNIDNRDATHEDFVKSRANAMGTKMSLVYDVGIKQRVMDADGKITYKQEVGLVDVARNGMTLDSADAEDITLSTMVDEVNDRLKDAGMPVVDVDKENDYAGLPLAALSQMYSRETLIKALLKEGIDAEALKDPKYDGDVHIVVSDLKPLPSEMFTEEYVDEVVGRVSPDDVTGSIRNLGLDDLRLLIEVSADNAEVLNEANKEFYNRIGYEEKDVVIDSDNEDKAVDNMSDATADDEKDINTEIVPLKQTLMTAMAGRFADSESLREHLKSPDEQTDVEKEWLSKIRQKIAKQVGIEKPTRNDPAYPEYLNDMDRIHVAIDDQHVVHWYVADKENPGIVQRNAATQKDLSGSIGQLFLPDKDGLIDLDYAGGSKGYAVAGYNAYFVTPGRQRAIMLRENANNEKAGLEPRWSKDETDMKFLKSEDSLAYRIRLSGFDEALSDRLDQLLTRQVAFGIDDTLGDNVMMNSLYKGKDTYLTRINNDLVMSDKSLVKHLSTRVYMDDAYFSDAGNKMLGRHMDDNNQLEDLAAKYTPKSLSGTVFDESNIAGLGNSHFLSQAALDLIENTKKASGADKYAKMSVYRSGRFLEHFKEGSEFQKDLALHPDKRFGLLLNNDRNKYHYGDPTDRVSMAGNQQVHADSYVDHTKLALMTFKGYTMDDGNLITEKYAERVGREQAEMVADVHIAQGDYAYLVNKTQDVLKSNSPKLPKGGSYTPEIVDDMRERFVEAMGTTSTRDGGYKLAIGDKLSTFHGNKTTISHVISEDEMQPGKEFEMFGQHKDLEVVMPPESIISRLNMGEVQELMDGKVEPIVYNNETVGYMGETSMINTEIKAANKMHAYGPGDGRHVGAQLLWMLNARKNSDVIVDEIYSHNGKAVKGMMDYLEVTGVNIDPETGVMSQGLQHKDSDLADPEYLMKHKITVIDPTKPSDSEKMLPVGGGYIKVPMPVHLPNMAPNETTSYLPVLPESLRQGQELPSGEVIEQDRTRRYKQIIELIESGKAEEMIGRASDKKPVLQTRVDSLASEIIRAKLGAADGSANKVSHIRRNVMGATVPNSATAPATANPTLPIDTIEVGPEVYKTLNLEDPNQKVLMWRDPALHAGSVMAFNVKLNKDISGVGMNPVIATPFGGDFDGDTYGIYAPRNTPESQKVLEEEYSVEAYLKDMGKKIEDREFVLTDVELNTGMDFVAGAVKSGVIGSNGKPISNKKDLETTIRTILEKGAYDDNSNISGELTDLWRASQEKNIGADKINLIDRSQMLSSMVDMATIGSKGKVELDEDGKVTNLKGLQQNLNRFDRLGYYDGVTKNAVYDHNPDGTPKFDEKLRSSVQQVMKNRYENDCVNNYKTGSPKVTISGHEEQLTTVAQADREIEKATVAKQLLTASSGQTAIDMNKTAVDIPDKTVSSRISEMTQVLTQAALQVKHEASIVPSLNQGIATISNLTAEGGLSENLHLETIQSVFNDMDMPDGYSQHFAKASYIAAATQPLYGDTNGTLEDAKPGAVKQDDVNLTASKGEVTEASAPLALMAYNGMKYIKSMAEANRSIYEGNVSGKLAQGLPSAYNKSVPEIDQIDDRAGLISTKYYEAHKQAAQSENREIRDLSLEAEKPLVKHDDLANIRPSVEDVKKVLKGTTETLRNAQVETFEEGLHIDDAITFQMGRSVQRPAVKAHATAKAVTAKQASSSEELQR